jgi:hypothetical protein
MFENLKKNIVRKAMQYTFDNLEKCTTPACFGDPAAMLTQWTPLKSGSANFQTHTLVSIQHHQMKFAPSVKNIFFSSAFFLFGIHIVTHLHTGVHAYKPLTALIGIIFICVGVLLFYFNFIPIVFDKQKGFFWKGWTQPDGIAGCKKIKCCVYLKKVHALQIISKQVKSSSSRGSFRYYFNYELNLVLKNSTRINVVYHGDKGKMLKESAKLAKFLDKPLWDASEKKIIDKYEFDKICTYIERYYYFLNRKEKIIFDRFKKHFNTEI